MSSNKLDALVRQLPEEAISFFAYFARFEYALKRGGFLKRRSEKNDGAEADWNCFAKKLGSAFFEKVKSSNIADKLLAKPPKKQIVKSDDLDWKCIRIHDVTTLFDAIRRARNNLFHGGKFQSGAVEDIARDKTLLCQARKVLELALEARASVKAHFEEGPS